ncbi:hypothetical protein GUITHDRAFT_145710 [Guillardia theta CCMP2712]|uniref:Thioredoxin domain-containing protein n=2 Tax=Guillardia theta TaxID=55529 RepID=L1IKA2_GUITC|nr:hypothetical protein GUITHDRAFT_145710 [Guillardia theta CCMP2712]EKX36547.1 hypothetical protein GUITHDRAFT_145710 [Guillardia theta CCMP2712]|eukprot:XP_005823527.1 hypothetical protein GUITHDRAFT_145710 [Guillardia theta CCMP2712]
MALLTGIDSFSFCPSSLLGASNRLGKSHCPRTFSRNPVLRESKSSKGKILITPADLSQAFEQMDADGSGSLSAEEVMSVLKAMGYAEQERRCIFENIDADKDGAVSKVEFLRACESETICAIVDEDSKDGGWKEELKEQDATPEDELSVKNFYKSLIQYMRKRPEEVEGKTARRAGRVGDGKVKELKSAEEFEKVMEEAGDFPVVVKFFASWCRKCLALKAKYSGIAKGYGERAIFVKIDIETKGASDLVKKRAGVVAIPTFQVWKGGQPIDKYVAGSVIAQIPGDLAKMIDKHIDGDFSLVKAIEQEPVVEEPPKQEKEQIQLGKAEVNQDAMAAWRAAQAAKTSFSRNPFKN